MKIDYIKGKPVKSFICRHCGEFTITGDKDKIERALEWKKLHDEGMNYRDIGKKYGVLHETVRQQVLKVDSISIGQ